MKKGLDKKYLLLLSGIILCLSISAKAFAADYVFTYNDKYPVGDVDGQSNLLFIPCSTPTAGQTTNCYRTNVTANGSFYELYNTIDNIESGKLTKWTPRAGSLSTVVWKDKTVEIDGFDPLDEFKYENENTVIGSINNENVTMKKSVAASTTARSVFIGNSTKYPGTAVKFELQVDATNKLSGRLSRSYADSMTNGFSWSNRPVAITAPTSVAPTVTSGGNVYDNKAYKSDLFSCTISNVDTQSPLICWISAVFNWSRIAILTSAVAAVIFAGILYMTSAGDPKRIEMAKKIIIGALSGVAVIILGQFFLTKVVGVSWL